MVGHQHPAARPGAGRSGLRRAAASTSSRACRGTSAPNGSPFLDGCLAYLEGTIREVATHGDHDIIVAELDFAATEPGEPLVYYRGAIDFSPSDAAFTTLDIVTRASEATRRGEGRA